MNSLMNIIPVIICLLWKCTDIQGLSSRIYLPDSLSKEIYYRKRLQKSTGLSEFIVKKKKQLIHKRILKKKHRILSISLQVGHFPRKSNYLLVQPKSINIFLDYMGFIETRMLHLWYYLSIKLKFKVEKYSKIFPVVKKAPKFQ